MKTILVYRGKRELKGGKLGYCYLRMNGDEPSQEQVNFGKKLAVVEQVGNLIEVADYNEETGQAKGPFKVVGFVTDDSLITNWSLEEKATEEARKLAKAPKHDANVEALIKAVRESAAFYDNRRALVAYIISRLV